MFSFYIKDAIFMTSLIVIHWRPRFLLVSMTVWMTVAEWEDWLKSTSLIDYLGSKDLAEILKIWFIFLFIIYPYHRS